MFPNNAKVENIGYNCKKSLTILSYQNKTRNHSGSKFRGSRFKVRLMKYEERKPTNREPDDAVMFLLTWAEKRRKSL